jgi:5-methylthioadenosine/S-adenosylhomocysteine deaminase
MRRLLIKRVSVLCFEAAGSILPAADIAIEGSRIVAVGRVPEDFRPDETLDGYNHLAMPGFWNAHTHAPMSLLRGYAEDLPGDRWFFERVRPAEALIDAGDVHWGAALAACEMIRGGTVGFNDHYFHMNRVAEVVEASGMKATLAWTQFGIPGVDVGSDLAGAAAFAERWHGAADGRIRCVLGPHSPYICPSEFLRDVSALARERRLGLHIHLAETAQQVQDSLSSHGLTPVAYLEASGVFDVPCVAAHTIHASTDDIAILRARGVSVVHCPISYLKLGLEVNDLRPMLDAGVNVALGTDGAASNNDMDMNAAVRFTALVQKFVRKDAETLAGDLPLRLATTNGARAMGFSESGVLATGNAADIVLVDLDRPHLYPRHDLVANLVHSARASDVTHVIVDGRVLYRNGELLTLDEEKIKTEVRRCTAKFALHHQNRPNSTLVRATNPLTEGR